MQTLSILRIAFLLPLILLAGTAFAQQACPTGQGRLQDGAPCIPSHLVNYLYCLSQSGGGKIELRKKDDVSKSSSLEVAIGGKGTGVVIKGEATGSVKTAEVARAVKELNEKLDPALTKNCKELASVPRV